MRETVKAIDTHRDLVKGIKAHGEVGGYCHDRATSALMPPMLAIDLVTIAQEVGRRGVVRERVHDLLRGPEGGGPAGDGRRRGRGGAAAGGAAG